MFHETVVHIRPKESGVHFVPKFAARFIESRASGFVARLCFYGSLGLSFNPKQFRAGSLGVVGFVFFRALSLGSTPYHPARNGSLHHTRFTVWVWILHSAIGFITCKKIEKPGVTNAFVRGITSVRKGYTGIT